MNISDRIKQVRAFFSLNQKEFASKLDVGFSTYQKYEMGMSKPGSDAIEGFIRLGINANWLLTGEGVMLLSDVQLSPAPSYFDRSRFVMAIEAVEEGLDAADRTMSPDKKAELFLAVYDLMEEPTNTKARVLQLVRLAA